MHGTVRESLAGDRGQHHHRASPAARPAKVDTVAVVAAIQRRHRNASEDVLACLLAERLREDEVELVSVCRRLVHAALSTLGRRENARRAPAKDQAAEEAAERAAIKSFAQAVRLKIGLQSIMPNGKPLKMCFGRELAQLGDTHSEFGEICKRIAAAIPADMTVGATLSASDVAELMEEPHGRRCGRAA